MKNLYILFVFLGLIMAQQGAAQNIRLQRADNMQLDPAISPTELNEIIQTLEETINAYAKAMSLYDTKQKRVTEASIDAFEKMFSPNARVVKDYAEHIPGELIDFKDYGLEVYNRLQLRGVEVVLTDAEIIAIKADALGFYLPTILVKKKIFNSINQENRINTITSGRILEQRISFDIYKDDLGRANISKIAPGVDIKPADDYTRIISLSPSVGTSVWNPGLSNYWNQNHADNTLSTKGGLNFSIGAEFMTDRLISRPNQSNRNLALSLGIRYASFSINSKLEDYSFEAYEATPMIGGTAGPMYYRMVNGLDADEALRINSLQIPLGVAYRVMQKPTSLVYIHARFIPGFILSGNSTLNGRGIYDGILMHNGLPSEFRIRRDGATMEEYLTQPDAFGPYRVSDEDRDQKLDGDFTPELGSATFAIQLSPTAYFSFVDDNPSLGVMVGLDLSYQFNSFLAHGPATSLAEAPLKYNDDFERGSLLNYFAEDLSGLSFGLRIGLFQRFNAEP